MRIPRAISIGVVVIGMAVAGWLLLRRPGSEPVEEDWTLDLSAVSQPTATVPLDVRALLDQIASDDPAEAAKAWNELGSRYQTASSFLADAGPAIHDARPIHFELLRTRFSGGGNTFVYYTPRTGNAEGATAYAHTVGQVLCYHLWQYEDVSNSGFQGNFRAWWTKYAPAHGLPPPSQSQ